LPVWGAGLKGILNLRGCGCQFATTMTCVAASSTSYASASAGSVLAEPTPDLRWTFVSQFTRGFAFSLVFI
jgi:hypothetical protein